MRQESALVRPAAHAGERLVHLVVQDFQRCMGSDADPEVVGPSPPVELADAVERDLEAAMVDRSETRRVGNECQYGEIAGVAGWGRKKETEDTQQGDDKKQKK